MKWFSVKDSLPDFIEDKDITKNVLCIVAGKVVLGQRHYIHGEGWLWACGAGYVFGDLATVEIEADDDYNVTHWMPLPEPPKDK
jgi:hypothetical protein